MIRHLYLITAAGTVACVMAAWPLPGASRSAHAEPAPGQLAVTTSAPPAQVKARPHAAYLELLGKSGLYSIGYDYAFTRRLGAGASLSAYHIDGHRIMAAAPYVNLYPLRPTRSTRHAWLVQAGLQIMHQAVISPVPEWPGVQSTDIGGHASTGYEYRNLVLVRAVVMAVAGAGGVAPWAGVSLGGTF